MIYLVRHGETEFNREGRYQGRLDSPLTDRGRRQARLCGQLLARHVDSGAIWTSPLPRAVETARVVEAALPDAELRIDERLREVSFGLWEGLTRAEIVAGWPGIRKRHPPQQWKLNAPDGEATEALMARLQALLQDAASRPEDVILVGHGIAGRLIRGLHSGLTLSAALQLPAPQGVVYRLRRGGVIDTLACADA